MRNGNVMIHQIASSMDFSLANPLFPGNKGLRLVPAGPAPWCRLVAFLPAYHETPSRAGRLFWSCPNRPARVKCPRSRPHWVFVGGKQSLAVIGATGESREAAPLQKVLLVIVLVGAAFAGGVIANGSQPGWAQAVLKLLPRSGSGIDTVPTASLVPTQDGDPVSVTESIPSAPVPPLVVGPVPEQPPPRTSPSPQDPKLAPTACLSLLLTQLHPPSSYSRDHQNLGSGPGTSSTSDRARDDDSRSTYRADEPGREGFGSSRSELRAKGRVGMMHPAPPTAILPPATLGSSRPPAGGLPVGPVISATPLRASGTNSNGSTTPKGQAWAELRRQMRELGVTRYWLEGDPDGPVQFRCVIPLAGQRAVGQQFEAEGADALQAADAALRRVALWRATEAP